MTAAPSRAHQDIGGDLYYQIHGFFRKHPRLRTYEAPFDVRFPAYPDQPDVDIKDVVQPDVCLCDVARTDDKGCRGAPEWIIEVLSSRTKKKDLQIKRDLYQLHGVPLYWIVHPRKRTVLYLELKDSRYAGDAEARMARGRIEVQQYAGLVIDWDDVFDRLVHD